MTDRFKARAKCTLRSVSVTLEGKFVTRTVKSLAVMVYLERGRKGGREGGREGGEGGRMRRATSAQREEGREQRKEEEDTINI